MFFVKGKEHYVNKVDTIHGKINKDGYTIRDLLTKEKTIKRKAKHNEKKRSRKHKNMHVWRRAEVQGNAWLCTQYNRLPKHLAWLSPPLPTP